MDSVILVFATFLASMLVVGYLAYERGGGNRVGYGLRFLSAHLPSPLPALRRIMNTPRT